MQSGKVLKDELVLEVNILCSFLPGMEHFRATDSYKAVLLGSFTSSFLVLCPTTGKRKLNGDWSLNDEMWG